MKACLLWPTSSTVSGATQVCPALKALPARISRAARLRSAPGSTSTGHLPPSSSVNGVRFGAAAAMILRPVAVLPVKTK